LSAAIGKGCEPARALVDLLRDALRGGWIVFSDIGNNTGKVVSGFGLPADFHLRVEHRLDSPAYLIVRKVFAPVELPQTFLYFLAQPNIVVKIVLDKLLYVAVRIAAVFGGDLI
jgi:hypothetical protein